MNYWIHDPNIYSVIWKQSKRNHKMNYCSVCLDTSLETAACRVGVLFLRMGYMHCTKSQYVIPRPQLLGFMQRRAKGTGPPAFSVTYRHNGASHPYHLGGYQGGHLDLGIGGYFQGTGKS